MDGGTIMEIMLVVVFKESMLITVAIVAKVVMTVVFQMIGTCPPSTCSKCTNMNDYKYIEFIFKRKQICQRKTF